MAKRPALLDLETYDWPYVTPPDLARVAHVNCDSRTILRMIAAGSLPGAYLVGRNWRIPTDVARAAFPTPRQKSA